MDCRVAPRRGACVETISRDAVRYLPKSHPAGVRVLKLYIKNIVKIMN